MGEILEGHDRISYVLYDVNCSYDEWAISGGGLLNIYFTTLSLMLCMTAWGDPQADFDDVWIGSRLTWSWMQDAGVSDETQPSFESQQSRVDFTTEPDPEARKWHVDMAFTIDFLKLSETEQMLDRRLDIPLKFDFLNVFARPRTPIDRKSSFSINRLQFGLGKRVSDRVILNWFFGIGPGVDRFHQRYLTADLRVNFKYGYYYTGFRAEIYPWGFIQYHNDPQWAKRFSASRFYYYAAIETGYVNAEGAGRYKFLGIRIYEDRVKVRDWILAGTVGLGWGIPISDRWSIQLSGDYSFHVHRPHEYNGWRITAGLRFRF